MAGPPLSVDGERKRWHSAELEGLGSLATGLVANLREALSKLQASQKKVARSKRESESSGSERAEGNEEKAVQDATMKKGTCDTPSDMRQQARKPPAWLAALTPPVKRAPRQEKSINPVRLASLTMATPQGSDHHRHPGPFGQGSGYHLPVDVTWGAWDDDDISDDFTSAEVSVSFSGEDSRAVAESARGGEVSTSSTEEKEEGKALCYEIVKGRKRRYVKGVGGRSGRGGKAGYTVVEEGEKRNIFQVRGRASRKQHSFPSKGIGIQGNEGRWHTDTAESHMDILYHHPTINCPLGAFFFVVSSNQGLAIRSDSEVLGWSTAWGLFTHIDISTGPAWTALSCRANVIIF